MDNQPLQQSATPFSPLETQQSQTPTPSLETPQSNKPTPKFSKKAIYATVIVLIILIGSLIWFFTKSNSATKSTPQSSQQPWNQNPIFNPSEAISKVGNETIYGSDLNYIAYYNFPASRSNSSTDNDKIKAQIIDQAKLESAIIQAAQKENILTIPPEILNNPNKNSDQRNKIINQIRDFIDQNTTKYSTSVISVWYYNMEKPKINEATARKLALDKITAQLSQLKSNTITMKQAGQNLARDTSLASIDKNYQGNSFSYVENWDFGNQPFDFPELYDAAIQLKPGEVSSVIEIIRLGTDLNKSNFSSTQNLNLNEKFFAIIKMDSLSPGKYSSLGDWTKQAIKNYQ